MSIRIIRTPFPSSDLTTERVARRANAHPRTKATLNAGPAPATPAPTPGVMASRDNPNPAGEAKILRRWSVAALIASAPRPQATV